MRRSCEHFPGNVPAGVAPVGHTELLSDHCYCELHDRVNHAGNEKRNEDDHVARTTAVAKPSHASAK